MVDSRTRKMLFGVLLAVASIALSSCASPEQPQVEEAPRAQEPAAVSTPASPVEIGEAVKLPAPEPEEIDDKVRVVFGEAAIADRNHNPYFFVGDFNGDASQDLALVLKPAPHKLDQLNEDFPKWMTREPLRSVLPRPVVATSQASEATNPASARGIPVLRGDTLLAVIHGNGPKGWRDPEATQTYLLKNVVGNGIRTRERKGVAGLKGKPMPQIAGDVIDQRLLGQSGFLYFSYSHLGYQWYDPVHYKPESMAGSTHQMQTPKSNSIHSGAPKGPGMSSKGN